MLTEKILINIPPADLLSIKDLEKIDPIADSPAPLHPSNPLPPHSLQFRRASCVLGGKIIGK